MGKLVKFDQRRRNTTAIRSHVTGGAQILMFTGVRYERAGLPIPINRFDPPKPKRKRG